MGFYNSHMARRLEYFSRRLRRSDADSQRWPFRLRLIVIVISLLILLVSCLIPQGAWYYVSLLFEHAMHR